MLVYRINPVKLSQFNFGHELMLLLLLLIEIEFLKSRYSIVTEVIVSTDDNHHQLINHKYS